MPLTGSELDLAAVVPTWSVVDFLAFVVYVVATIVWPGRLVRRLLGWTSGIRAERLAQTLLVGIVAHAVSFWLLLIAGLGGVGSPIGLVHLGAMVLLAAAQVLHDVRRRDAFRSRLAETRRRISPWEACGYAIVAVLATYYLVRTVPLFDYDGERLRLYGAAHSDKLTSMMPCAGLRYDAPSDNLRFAGYKFLSHYFPHLATASLELSVGTTYTAGYWFHWPLLGIAANGLAVLGFARRMLKSYPAGCLALTIFGLWQVTALMKPLDITPALALSAIGCLDRFMRSRRRRWGVAAVLLIGAMPCYEVFHAATLVAALGLWGAVGIVIDVTRRRSIDFARIVLPAAAAIAMFVSLRGLNVGHLGDRPQVVVNNTFGDSYRRDWLARAKVDDAVGRTLTTLYAWNRNHVAAGSDDAEPQRPAWYQRVVGRATFGIGMPVYIVWRFGLWAVFGIVHLWRRRRNGLRTGEALTTAVVCVGFAAPCLIDVGMHGDGQWWSSPNLYRATEFAAWLAATLGSGVLVQAAAHWRLPRSWLLLLVAAWAVRGSLHDHRPVETYLELPREQVETMAYLREHVPYDEIIIHPWSDCSIRRTSDGGEAYLQKRFFMLVSELAGRRCFCEGRAEYLIWNGSIPHDEIDRRLRLRRAFYREPSDEDVAAVLGRGGVRWVVSDALHPPPQAIEPWPIVFRSGVVEVRCPPNYRS